MIFVPLTSVLHFVARRIDVPRDPSVGWGKGREGDRALEKRMNCRFFPSKYHLLSWRAKNKMREKKYAST